MFAEIVDDEAVDARRAGGQAWNGDVVGAADLLAQVVSGELGFGLLALLLQLTVLFRAFFEAQVQLERRSAAWWSKTISSS